MKPLAQQTLYELLEIPPDAPTGDVDAAYARARALYGPDSIATYTLLAPDEAELLRARLEEARATLTDPDARARYDERLAKLAEAVPPPSTPWAPPRDPPSTRPIELLAASPGDEDDAEGPDAPEPAAVARPAPPPPPAPVAAPIRLEREVSRPAMTPPPAAAPPPPAALPPSATAYVPEATTWTGEVLRNVREARGISIQQISERTKVLRHHIEAIEAERFAALPAPVYLRGILLGLARELRLDGQKVARSYLERLSAATGGPTPAPRR